MSAPLIHTPGPWAWFNNQGHSPWYLATPHSGHLLVMDFARFGMNRAQPRFAIRTAENKSGQMVKAHELPNVRTHPDARLISAAPELLDACELALMYLTNVNAAEPADVAAKLAAALRAAGYEVPDIERIEGTAAGLVKTTGGPR